MLRKKQTRKDAGAPAALIRLRQGWVRIPLPGFEFEKSGSQLPKILDWFCDHRLSRYCILPTAFCLLICCGVAKLGRRLPVKQVMHRFESCPHSHRGVAQLVSAPALGAGGRKFESCHPDF